MLMKIVVFGMGVKIPQKKFGINGPSGVYILTKVNMNAPHDLYGMTRFAPAIDGDSGAMLMGYVDTKWISMTGENDAWIKNIDSLTGTTLNIELSGTVLFKGSIDLKITSIDSTTFDETVLTDKKSIPSSGMSFKGATLEGTLLKYPRSVQSIKAAS